jgi:predicted RNase H-like HicB family nuclease
LGTQKFIYWQDEMRYCGFPEAYPDYWTQGETIEELEENRLDIFKELTSGAIPCVRKIAELQAA